MQTYEINLWLDKKIIEKIVKQFEKDGGGAIAIPKGWVTKIEYLKETHADVRN